MKSRNSAIDGHSGVNRPVLVSVEAIIGAGKSTLLDAIAAFDAALLCLLACGCCLLLLWNENDMFDAKKEDDKPVRPDTPKTA